MIFNLNGTVSLYNVTLSHNSVALPKAVGKSQGAGGALYNLSLGNGAPVATSDLYNSILSNSSATISNSPASSAIPVSDVVNAPQTGSAIVNATASNLILVATGPINTGSLLTGTDPQLGDLFPNGGLTMTRLPAASSPVIGLGDSLICYSPPVSAVDQRGNRRPTACTLGAVQVATEPTLATGCSQGDTTPPPSAMALLGLWLSGLLAAKRQRAREKKGAAARG